jgi:lysophospholipase L1-like esterase
MNEKEKCNWGVLEGNLLRKGLWGKGTIGANNVGKRPLGMGRNESGLEYWQKLVLIFGQPVAGWASAETSGTDAIGIAGGYHGVYSAGIELGYVDAPTGHKAPRFGADYLNVYSAGAVGAISTGEFTVVQLCGVPDAAAWADGATMRMLYLAKDASNRVVNRKVGKQLTAQYNAGGTVKESTKTVIHDGLRWWLHGMTVSKSNDRLRLYFNGVQENADVTGLGVFAGPINSQNFCIGAENAPGTQNPFAGYLSDTYWFNGEATADAMMNAFMLLQGVKTLTVIGDSISTYSYGYQHLLRSGGWNGGLVRLKNHAVGGHTIMANLDGQVAEAASDNADLILIEMGTNDNNLGDMGALQVKVESNLATLKTTNPRAPILFINVLPRWTDVGGGTPVDKGNIRTAIAAACTAQSVTCLDTFTIPWINAAQTNDGLHPNAAGHVSMTTNLIPEISTANGQL